MDAFQTAADILALADTLHPAVSHPSAFSEWREVAETVAQDTITSGEVAMTRKEEDRLEEAKEVGLALLEKFLTKASSVGWGAQPPEERRAAVQTLLALPQVPQRTAAWYVQGKEVLTASEFGALYASARTRGQLVLRKAEKVVADDAAAPAPLTNRLACMTCEMGPFDWGVRFEPVVKQVLEARWGVRIAESGRLLHPRDPKLAASPDGLVLEAADPARVGRLVEIKCPISRTIGAGVPFDYWCQMQIQMEVTGIGECDYVEVKIQSIQKHETELPAGAEPEGRLWLLQEPRSTEMAYAYTEAERAAKEEAGWDVVEQIPWRVAGLWTKTVARDRTWYEGTAELRAAFWRDVEGARAGTWTLPESTRQRKGAGAAVSTGATKSAGLTVIVQKEGAAGAAASSACLIFDEEEHASPAAPEEGGLDQAPAEEGPVEQAAAPAGGTETSS
jgi:hypothetical protein